MQALTNRLKSGYAATLHRRAFPRGLHRKIGAILKFELTNIGRILRADVVVMHTPLSLSLGSIVMARLLGRRVLLVVWDLYPESSVVTGTFRNPLLICLYDLTERASLRLAHSVFVPSRDYAAHPKLAGLRDVHFLPIWPIAERQPVRARALHEGEPIRIGFAGQVTVMQNVPAAIGDIAERLSERKIEFHLFGSDTVPAEIAELAERRRGQLRIIPRGYLEGDVFQHALAALDAGLVAIDPAFTLPAFPSKTTAYVSSGLPVIFRGPPNAGMLDIGVASGAVLVVDEHFNASRLDQHIRSFSGAQTRYLAMVDAPDAAVSRALPKHMTILTRPGSQL
jgi:hypothetical protein